MSDEMTKPLRKRPAPRKKSVAASSPAPMDVGSLCGHDGSGCGPDGCGVRYVGPTTHIRDHHAVHAARGVSHVWTAAIVSGLAIVLTGAVAWTAVDAQTQMQKREADRAMPRREDVAGVAARMDRLEQLMREMRELCKGNLVGQTPPKVEKPTSTKPVLPKPTTSTKTGATGTSM